MRARACVDSLFANSISFLLLPIAPASSYLEAPYSELRIITGTVHHHALKGMSVLALICDGWGDKLGHGGGWVQKERERERERERSNSDNVRLDIHMFASIF